jgi:putative oxidoreductase
MKEKFLQTTDQRAVALIRVLVGWVFLSEGIQKFLYPDALGVGRFTKIGIVAPHFFAPFVGVVEIVGGGLLLLGFLVRASALALLIDILVAILSTKVPILLGHGFWSFTVPKPPYGFWAMLHEARTDFSMLLGLIFLLLVGAGGLSIDLQLVNRRDYATQRSR